MAPIKILLITPLLVFVVLLATRLRSRTITRLLFIVVALTGVGFVAFPDATNIAAHWVGVGRGADLVFYVALVASFFAHVVSLARMRDLEAAHTELIRQWSIESAERLAAPQTGVRL